MVKMACGQPFSLIFNTKTGIRLAASRFVSTFVGGFGWVDGGLIVATLLF
jgi:hypothetical protein